jgi:hypothetical protein
MIRLTTPFDPGDFDPGRSYTHVAITSHAVWPTFIELRVVRGYLDPEFVAGKLEETLVTIRDNPRAGTTAFTDLMNREAVGRERFSAVFSRLLHQHLVSSGMYPGVVV